MRALPIGAPVRITDAGPDWVRGETGIVSLDLGGDVYLVTLDQPCDDGSGDGPYSGVPVERSALSTDLT